MEKTCNSCGISYQATTEFFHKKKSGKYGLRGCCKQCISMFGKQYYSKPGVKEYKNEYQKKYNSNTTNKARANAYYKNKKVTDPQYKTAHIIRKYTCNIITNNYTKGKAVTLLGGTSEFVRSFLESKFYNHPKTGEQMTWDNRGNGKGKWNIDHVQELSSFDLTDQEQYILAGHWTNLQPLWHVHHVEKHTSEV